MATPSAESRAEAKAQLMLRLRARGLRDLTLLRALEKIPRETFVAPAYADLALRDVAAPLPCGQTLEAPSALAQMLTLLAAQPHHRILEIGSGSGYSAAVLSLIGRDVVSLECFQRLRDEARARLDGLGVAHVRLVWGDGHDVAPALGLFDRILVHGAVEGTPPKLFGALGQGGVLVAARKKAEAGSELVRYSRAADDRIEERVFGPCRAQGLLHGLFRQD
jgi:protein-L-isoaspartate(D-aspartate) O-methyltransferase